MRRYAGVVVLAIATVVVPAVARGQLPSKPVVLGVHLAFDASDGRVEEERIGAQIHLPILDPVEIVPQFSFFLVTRQIWRTNVSARIRPDVLGSLVSVGYGIAISRNAATTSVRDLVVVSIDTHRWTVEPFAEFHLLDVIGGAFSADIVLGLKMRR